MLLKVVTFMDSHCFLKSEIDFKQVWQQFIIDSWTIQTKYYLFFLLLQN